MKVIRTNNLKCVVKLSHQEWQGIGERAGWTTPIEDIGPTPKPPEKGISLEDIKPVPLPIVDKLEVQIEKYTDRTWAVYVNGQLLCVTVYKKGANAVKDLVDRLWEAGNPRLKTAS
jgi:hypothetical protein